VVHAPRAVFAAFRDETDEKADARIEVVNAIVILAGISTILWAPATGRMLDDPEIDGILVAVLAFLTGALYGLAAYFLLGILLRLGIRAEGGVEPKRRARHLVAYASVPLVASLLLLTPVRLGIFGGDVFRSGGADDGAAGSAFVVLELACVGWSLALLAIAVRVVHRWPWRRAVVAVVPVALLAAVIVAAALFA
jgi:hypothetical protein